MGGKLGMSELAMLHGGQHGARALEHRPCDASTLRASAVELAARGLTARDIAASLGLTEAAVRQLLAWESA